MIPSSPRVAAALCAVVIFLCFDLPVFARVGETQDVIERRMLQPNLGKVFFRSKDKDAKEEKERLKEEREQIFNDAQKFFPDDTRESVYWKSALANKMSSENGWKVHVFYMGGRSSLEAYRRVGESLNEFEVRALLAVNRGNSVWKKVDQKGGGINGIGSDYELEDGSMRAKQKGDWLMIFSARLDTYVIEQQKTAKALSDREAERKAPESVIGF
jgi:hypothetical protein